MSEEQVLPELDVTDADREKATLCGTGFYKNFSVGAKSVIFSRERELRTALASLAQSEAERERLQRDLVDSHELFKATFGLATENANKLARERELHRWRDCKQEMPPKKTLVIVHGGVAYFREDGWWSWTGGVERITWEVTHWMPLPKPPALLEDSKPVATTKE